MLNFWAICLFFLHKRIVMQLYFHLDEILAASRYGGRKPVDGNVGCRSPKAKSLFICDIQLAVCFYHFYHSTGKIVALFFHHYFSTYFSVCQTRKRVALVVQN